MDNDDKKLIIFLAGDLSTTAAKDNWVDHAGKLPAYITKVAKGLKKSGKSTSTAIAIAISQIKRWAAGGGGVDADTKAKSVKAVAEWEALKAKNKSNKLVKASRHDDSEYVMLTNLGVFNTDMVRTAWNSYQSAKREAYRIQARLRGTDRYEMDDYPVPYSYIKELWTDHILIENESEGGRPCTLSKVPFTVDGATVSFGEEVHVEVQYVEVEDPDEATETDDEELSETEIQLLSSFLSGVKVAPELRGTEARPKL